MGLLLCFSGFEPLPDLFCIFWLDALAVLLRCMVIVLIRVVWLDSTASIHSLWKMGSLEFTTMGFLSIISVSQMKIQLLFIYAEGGTRVVVVSTGATGCRYILNLSDVLSKDLQ